MSELVTLFRLTLTDPRAGLRQLLLLNLPPAARWAGLALTAVSSALVLHLGLLLSPPPEEVTVGLLFASPLQTAVVQMGVMLASVLLIHGVGRSLGGTGRLEDAVLLVAWLQAIMVAVQVAQTLALLLLPPAAVVLGYLSIVLFFWLASNLIAELHGFSSALRVFGAVVAVFVGLVIVMSLVLTAIWGPEVLSNV